MCHKTNIELLSPAGDTECLGSAVLYGADAVFLAGQEFGMRTASSNFNYDEMKNAVRFAHEHKVKVHITCNTLPRNNELCRLAEFLAFTEEVGADALIIADIGVLALANKYAPSVEIHMSTQTGIVNYETAKALYDLGAKRVVLARELSLDDIAEIRAKTPEDLELEAFVHGAMCMSYSGRCLLSAYLTERDANRGDCSQPCRWEYSLVEKNRPGQKMDIFEDGHGSYILNSRDLCMINHIPDLVKAGIYSFKIEGRAKSSYYVASTTHAYRNAIDHYLATGEQSLPTWIQEEVMKISHRDYSTGFYYKNEPGQTYDNGGYIREYDVVAVVEEYDNGVLTFSQRNKFYDGDILEVLEPGKPPYEISMNHIRNENDEEIVSTPHAKMIIRMNYEHPIQKGAFLRKKRVNNLEK